MTSFIMLEYDVISTVKYTGAELDSTFTQIAKQNKNAVKTTHVCPYVIFCDKYAGNMY